MTPWCGGQRKNFESPAEASPWFCDVYLAMDDSSVFGGMAIDAMCPRFLRK